MYYMLVCHIMQLPPTLLIKKQGDFLIHKQVIWPGICAWSQQNTYISNHLDKTWSHACTWKRSLMMSPYCFSEASTEAWQAIISQQKLHLLLHSEKGTPCGRRQLLSFQRLERLRKSDNIAFEPLIIHQSLREIGGFLLKIDLRILQVILFPAILSFFISS